MCYYVDDKLLEHRLCEIKQSYILAAHYIMSLNHQAQPRASGSNAIAVMACVVMSSSVKVPELAGNTQQTLVHICSRTTFCFRTTVLPPIVKLQVT